MGENYFQLSFTLKMLYFDFNAVLSHILRLSKKKKKTNIQIWHIIVHRIRHISNKLVYGPEEVVLMDDDWLMKHNLIQLFEGVIKWIEYYKVYLKFYLRSMCLPGELGIIFRLLNQPHRDTVYLLLQRFWATLCKYLFKWKKNAFSPSPTHIKAREN